MRRVIAGATGARRPSPRAGDDVQVIVEDTGRGDQSPVFPAVRALTRWVLNGCGWAGPRAPGYRVVVNIADTYTGHVEPGGDAARRTLDALTITKLSVGPMDNNAYLLVCRTDNEALLIDAANDPDRISDLIGHGPDRPALRTVVTTHQHQDHWQALGAVAGANGANTAAHPLDAEPLPVPPDFLVEHGDTLKVGQVTLEVIHLRGHTPGSIALLYRDPAGHPHLFTGDSLFPGGIGRTTSTEDFASLLGDVESRIFAELPDDTWFYPGHGDDSTLGAERPKLAEWRERGW